MNIEPVKILLIEDDQDEAQAIVQMFYNINTVRFELQHTDNLESALAALAQDQHDVILLDLTLTDIHSIDPFRQIRQHAPAMSVIVLTDTGDETLGLKLVQMGAQDYLIKSQITDTLLVRSVRYAIERHRLQTELEQARQQEQHMREFRSLEHLARLTQTSVTSRLFGAVPLRESLPQIFDTLVQRYGALLERALEQRTFKSEHHMSEDLRTIADDLGFLKAGPRDVVKIHSIALKHKAHQAVPLKAQAYVEEGRLMVLELMGYLVSYYRNYALGTNILPPNTSEDTMQEKGGRA